MLKEFHCRRVDQSLSPVEHCSLACNVRSSSIALTGPLTLRSCALDQIDATVCFARDAGAVSQSGVPFIVRLTNDRDMVVLMDSVDDRDEFLECLGSLQQRRLADHGIHVRFVRYVLDVRFEEFILQSVPGSAVGSYVRWQAETPACVIPFPHSRLDFLSFHRNRSVLTRLSEHGDTVLELSLDDAEIAGHVILDYDTGMGGDDGQRAFAAGARAALLSFAASAKLTSSSGAPTPAVSTSTIEQLFCTGYVVIMSNLALYLTERTGRIVCRIALKDVQSMSLPAPNVLCMTHTDHPSPAANVGRDDRSGVGSRSVTAATRAGSERPHAESGAGAVGVLVLRNKYASDIFRRLSAVSASMPVLSLSGVRGASGGINTSAAAAGSPSPTPSTLVSSALGQFSAANDASSIPTFGTVVFPPRREIRAAWTQTTESSNATVGRATSTPRDHLAPSVAPLRLPSSEPLSFHLLVKRNEELCEAVAQRDVIIQLLQRKWDSLRLQQQQSQSHGDRGGHQRPPSPVPSARKGTSCSGGATPRSAAATPRGAATGGRIGSVPSLDLGGGGALGTCVNGDASDAARCDGPNAPQKALSSGNSTLAGLRSEVDLLRHYTALLEEQARELANGNYPVRIASLERRLAILLRSVPERGFAAIAHTGSDDEDLDDEPEGQHGDPLQMRQELVALRHALDNAAKREHYLQTRLNRSQEEHRSLVAATNEALSDIGAKASASVHSFVVTYEGARIPDFEATLRACWKEAIEGTEELELKVQQECAVRLAEMKAANGSLVQELRAREADVDRLAAAAAEASAIAAASTAAPAANHPQFHHPNSHHASTLGFPFDDLRRPEKSTVVSDLDSKRVVLEGKIRGLSRQLDDLTRARDALVDFAAFPRGESCASMESLTTGTGSRAGGSGRGDGWCVATEAATIALKAQVVALEKLSHVPLLVNRVASLEVGAAELESLKVSLAEAKAEAGSANQQLESLRASFAVAQQERQQSRAEARAATMQLSQLREALAAARPQPPPTSLPSQQQHQQHGNALGLLAAAPPGGAVVSATSKATNGALTPRSSGSASTGPGAVNAARPRLMSAAASAVLGAHQQPFAGASQPTTPRRGGNAAKESTTPIRGAHAAAARESAAERTMRSIVRDHPDWRQARTPSSSASQQQGQKRHQTQTATLPPPQPHLEPHEHHDPQGRDFDAVPQQGTIELSPLPLPPHSAGHPPVTSAGSLAASSVISPGRFPPHRQPSAQSLEQQRAFFEGRLQETIDALTAAAPTERHATAGMPQAARDSQPRRLGTSAPSIPAPRPIREGSLASGSSSFAAPVSSHADVAMGVVRDADVEDSSGPLFSVAGHVQQRPLLVPTPGDDRTAKLEAQLLLARHGGPAFLQSRRPRAASPVLAGVAGGPTSSQGRRSQSNRHSSSSASPSPSPVGPPDHDAMSAVEEAKRRFAAIKERIQGGQ